MPENPETFQYVSLSLSLILLVVMYTLYSTSKKRKYLESEVTRKESMLADKPIEEIISVLQSSINALRTKFDDGQPVYSMLTEEIKKSDERYKYIKEGLLPPTYKFDDSEALKDKIAECVENQYQVIRAGNATESYSDWTWMGSRSEGNKMVRAYQALLLRAFNSEFDMIRKKMRHSSYDTASNKLDRLEQQLAKLGETARVSISYQYMTLKQDELKVWHDEQMHKEEQKIAKKKQQALLREQNKQSGSNDTEELEDDIYYRKSDLLKAQKIAKELHGGSALDMEQKMATMQKEIEKLEAKFERATSQAQLTRSGYIYVISNIGSFGEGVIKIGMTRRLEPMDRVVELGDASVPFKFDVHTLAFVDDAPTVEKELHRRFTKYRVNTENHRKEFFKVSSEQVEEAMKELGIESDWYFDVEAKEYRESLLFRKALKKETVKAVQVSTQLPLSI